MTAKRRDGIVYSTNPDYKYEDVSGKQQETPPPAEQLLYIWIDSRNRSGKTVTVIRGFKGNEKDLEQLSTALKKHCGSGGTVKNGEIIIQGNFREKIIAWLNSKGYKSKKAGGS